MDSILVMPESREAWLASAKAIKQGNLVVFPTDTVYGLGCDPHNSEALDLIYVAKNRPQQKALPLLLSDVTDLSNVAGVLSKAALTLAERFWPGGLTIVVQRSPDLPADLGSGDTIAVRLPAHAGLRYLIQLCGGALAVTSANSSDQPDALQVEQALAYLGDSAAIYIDGGQSPGNRPSTVVNCTGDLPRILRDGAVPREQIIEAIGDLEN